MGMPIKYQKIMFEKEQDYKGDDGGDRYTVYVDSKKFAEHLRFDEVIRIIKMIEESGEKSE